MILHSYISIFQHDLEYLKYLLGYATHPPTVVDAGSDLPDKGRGANEEKDDGEEAREVEDGRHFPLVGNAFVLVYWRFDSLRTPTCS